MVRCLAMLKATMPDIFKLFRLYGQKVKRP